MSGLTNTVTTARELSDESEDNTIPSFEDFPEPPNDVDFFKGMYQIGSALGTGDLYDTSFLRYLTLSTLHHEEDYDPLKAEEINKDSTILVHALDLLSGAGSRSEMFRTGNRPPAHIPLRPYNETDLQILLGKIAGKVFYLREKYFNPNHRIHKIDPIVYLRDLAKQIQQDYEENKGPGQ